MKGQGWPAPYTLYIIFILIASIAALVIFVNYVSSFGQSQCLRETYSELRPLTGAFATEGLGVGKLLGKPEFTIALTLRSSCVDQIIFGDKEYALNKCREVCEGTDRFKGDQKKCLNECALCVGSKGCIIVVPYTPGLVKEVTGVVTERSLDPVRQARANIKVFNSPDYGFSPVTFPAPKEGTEFKCLTFTMGRDRYAIDEKPVTREQCEVTEVGLS